MKDDILREVTAAYLDSIDFNGIPAIRLTEKLDSGWNEMHDALQELIEEDLVGVLYSDTGDNPHILRKGFLAKDVQISKLNTDELLHTCLYPSPKHLNRVVDVSKYSNEPYKLCLALGEPQLAYRSFDLSVLEFYRNDPRYFYSNNDISGWISAKSDYSRSGQMHRRDQVVLETFGFSHDHDLNRAVAVYLRYLANLSPEHQQIWRAKELEGNYQLHPDYYRREIGNWGGNVSIFSAFVKELYIINRMAEAMGRPPLFKQDYGEYGEGRPQKFSFLVRPTLEEFNDFVLLLDKLLSENINKKFFQGEVAHEIEKQRKDGKITVEQKGSLQILDNWMRDQYETADWEPWDECMKVLRYIRKQRQEPAHAINENVFSQRYFKEQRELIISAYKAVKILRTTFAQHPSVISANIEIPNWLAEAKIWTC